MGKFVQRACANCGKLDRYLPYGEPMCSPECAEAKARAEAEAQGDEYLGSFYFHLADGIPSAEDVAEGFQQLHGQDHDHTWGPAQGIVYGDKFTDMSGCPCGAVRLVYRWGGETVEEIRFPA